MGFAALGARIAAQTSPQLVGPAQAASNTKSARCGVAQFVQLILNPQATAAEGPAARLLRAAAFVVAVMRQASHQRLTNLESAANPDAWLGALLHSIGGALARWPADEQDSEEIVSEDYLLSWIALLSQQPSPVMFAPGSDSADAPLVSAIDAIKALRALLRSKAASELGSLVATSFCAAVTMPNFVEGDEPQQTSDDADDDVDSDTADELLSENDDEDQSAEVPKLLRKWGDRPSFELPERFLMKEHWWALDPAEQNELTMLAHESLTEPADMPPGVRPPAEHFIEGFIASVALATGQTIEGACKVRIVLESANATLQDQGQLPRSRYLLAEATDDGRIVSVSVWFSPDDRFHRFWAEGVLAPLELPSILSTRIGQLADGVIDAELQELLPFVPEGWTNRTGEWLAKRFGRSIGEMNLAIRHALARELYAATASRAVIELACVYAQGRRKPEAHHVALSGYVHPGAARNHLEILRAATVLIDPSGAPALEPQGRAFGHHLSADLMRHIAVRLKAQVFRADASRIELHNALATYTVALLVVATGHRHSLHLFHFPWDLELEALVVFICDKLRVGSEARFVPLARAAAKQLLIYRRGVVDLIQDLQPAKPALARRVAHAAGIAYQGDRTPGGALAGTQGVGQFFLIDGTALKSIDAKFLDAAFETVCTDTDWAVRELDHVQRPRSIVRRLRKNLATYLWAAGASGLQIEAWLGQNREWHVHGEASAWNVLDHAARVRPLIEQYLAEVGWAPTEPPTVSKGASAWLMVLPDLAVGDDGYEGRQRAGDQAISRARAAVREALMSELADENDVIALDDADIDRIRVSVAETLVGDSRARDKVLEVFRVLSDRWRRGGRIRISAASVNRIRSEPGPVEVGFARALTCANEIRARWAGTTAAFLGEFETQSGDAEAARLAVILSALVIHDGILDQRQLWPLLESVRARESKKVGGCIQVRAEVETRSAIFERVVYLTRMTSATVRGLHQSFKEAPAGELDRTAIERHLAELIGRIVPQPGRKAWTLADLARVFRPWWFLRLPGFLYAVAIGNRAAPSADAISEATLLGAKPPRLTRLAAQRRRLEGRELTEVQAEAEQAIQQLFEMAAGRHVDANQASRTQRQKLRRVFDGELPQSLQALMSEYPIVEVRVRFIEHLLVVGGLEKAHLAFNTIIGYDGRLARRLYSACWENDIRESDAEAFDELYASSIERERGSLANAATARKSDSSPDLLMTALRTFHWFLRTSYQAPPCKTVRLAFGSCRQSRPRSAVLAPRLRNAVIDTVRRITKDNPNSGSAAVTALLAAQSFGTRKREALCAMVRDFDLSGSRLRLRVQSNRANKVKNTRAGRRVVPWPLAKAEHVGLLRGSVRTESATVQADRFLLADPGGQTDLMPESLVIPVALTALKSESGNAAMNLHSQRHGFGTGIVCAVVPAVGDVAPCVRIREEFEKQTDSAEAIQAMAPSLTQWPFVIERAAMWHGATVGTLLDVYFHGATWMLAEHADACASDDTVDDAAWAALLSMTRTNLVKLRAKWRRAEGNGTDCSCQRIVRHFVMAMKLPEADVVDDLGPLAGAGVELPTVPATMPLTFVAADKLLVRRRQEGLTIEQLTKKAAEEHALDPDAVRCFLRAAQLVEADTGLRDFEPLNPASQRTTRSSRAGVWRNSARRQALLARFEVLALDDQSRSSLQALATEWRQWVDRERPVLVVRSVERLMDVIKLLSLAGVPTGHLKIMASSSVPVDVFAKEWASGLRVGRELCHRFSRGYKGIPVEEFGVELDDAVHDGSVRNADLHRAFITLSSMQVLG